MKNENAETEKTAGEEVSEEVSKKELDRLILHHVWASIGIGLVPLPIVDMVGLTAIQLNLVRKIAKAHEIPFLRDKVKNILGSLIGSGIPSATGLPLAASIAKAVPVVGWTAGAVTMPAIAGAATYAVGKVFVQHFASGGTFLTFDPDKVRDYFTEMFREGQEIAKEGDKLAEDVKETCDTETDAEPDKLGKDSKKQKKGDKNSRKSHADAGKNAVTEKK